MSCLWLSISLIGGARQPASGHPAGGAKHYSLCCGLQATVQGHALVITDAKGRVVARNSQLIRLAEDNPTCPADGFSKVVSKGNYFTIEQQNCDGWFFFNEYITFRYVPATRQIQLHQYGLSLTDRREPNQKLPDKVSTEKQFGQRYFQQVTLGSLALLTR